MYFLYIFDMLDYLLENCTFLTTTYLTGDYYLYKLKFSHTNVIW